MTTKDILYNVLTITHYSGDKEEIVTKFDELTATMALSELLSLKPEEKREEVIRSIEFAKSDSDRIKVLQHFFQEEIINTAFKKASQDSFTKILEGLIPTLQEEEKNSLQDYLTSLK